MKKINDPVPIIQFSSRIIGYVERPKRRGKHITAVSWRGEPLGVHEPEEPKYVWCCRNRRIKFLLKRRQMFRRKMIEINLLQETAFYMSKEGIL